MPRGGETARGGRMRAGRGGRVSAAALGQRGGSGAEHEAAGVGGHLEAVARGVAGAEERDAAAVAELVDGQLGGAAGGADEAGCVRALGGGRRAALFRGGAGD